MQYIRISNARSFEFELFDCNGNPLDLSNCTMKFIVKRYKTDPDSEALLSQDIVNSETNNIMFQFDATETHDLLEGSAYCALKKFNASNMNDEIWSDNCQIVREVFSE